MTDPLSISATTLTLITTGIKAGKVLRDLIDNFQKHPKIVRELKAEVQSLEIVLGELAEAASDDHSEHFTALRLPLHCCGEICREFHDLVQKCVNNTSDSRRNLRDWSKLYFESEKINAFRITLSGYKSTIQIALGRINLHSSRVTLECLRDYQGIIEDTKTDLKEQLDRIENILAPSSKSPASKSAYLQWTTSRGRIQEEQSSIIKCLEICEEVDTYIADRQSTAIQGQTVQPDDHTDRLITTQSLEYSSSSFTHSALSSLRGQIVPVRTELRARYQAVEHDEPQQASSVKAERLRNCLSICDQAQIEANMTRPEVDRAQSGTDSAQAEASTARPETAHARVNLYEDVTTDADSRQYLVSTVGDLISARRVTTGARSVMVIGQLSNESLQQSFQAFSTAEPKGTISTSTEGSAEGKTGETQTFARYGEGRNLGNRTGPG